MIGYIIRRLLSIIPTLLGVATLIFLLVRVLPGDPAVVMLGDYATPSLIEAFREKHGLDDPLPVQYISFLSQLASGDLGVSVRNNQPVAMQIARAFPYTAELALGAMLVSVVIGVTAGVIAAIKQHTWLDTTFMVGAMTGYSMPAFWLGLILLIVFALRLGWFPVLGTGEDQGALVRLRHLALPVAAVGLRQAGLIARMTRARLVEILNENYITTAHAKGISESKVILIHAMKNASIPIVTVIGLSVGQLLGGTLVTEIVFTRPGLGRLLVDAVFTRDYTMLQSLVLVWGLALIVINLIVDLSYTYLDPRIRYS